MVAFCGPGNAARVIGSNGVLGHYFAHVGEDIVDFSVGDWRGQVTGDTPWDRLPNGDALPPIQWRVKLPDFWWRPAAALTTPRRSHGEPPLGERPGIVRLPPTTLSWPPGCDGCGRARRTTSWRSGSVSGRRAWLRRGGVVGPRSTSCRCASPLRRRARAERALFQADQGRALSAPFFQIGRVMSRSDLSPLTEAEVAALVAQTGRSCGSCSLCCKVLFLMIRR